MPQLRLLALLLFAIHVHGAPVLRRLDGQRMPVARAEEIARTALAKHRVTGAQIAIVERGSLAWSFAYGLRQRDPDLPMQGDTTTWAASITKGVFASYVMHLVEQGILSLDTPIARILPRPLTDYEAYKDKAVPLLADARYQTLTPRHLLSHTSGLLNFASLEKDSRMHLHFQPGSRYWYSGEGLNLLQFVIEQRLQKPLAAAMQDAIFQPLKMLRTSMVFRPEFAENIADRFGSEGQFLAKTRRNPARAAGSMTSTAEDLARYLIALLDGRVIGKKALREMLRTQIAIRTESQFSEKTASPGSDPERLQLGYGLGWGLLNRTRFGPAFFKEGHGDGAQTYAVCFLKSKSCMIIMTNSDNGELAFRELLEGIWGNTEIPWTWESYTEQQILENRKSGN